MVVSNQRKPENELHFFKLIFQCNNLILITKKFPNDDCESSTNHIQTIALVTVFYQSH